MLTENSTVIYNLLCELADTCDQLGLLYFLAPRLTLNVFLEAGMPEDPGVGQILMRAEDMEKLRLYYQEKLPKGRALESMMDGGTFPGFFLRYEDLNTLYLNPNQGDDYQNPCMNVEIYPIRPGIYRTLGFRLLALEKTWRSTCFSPNGLPSKKLRLLALPLRLACRVNRPGVAAFIYQRLLEASTWGGKIRTNCFLLMRDRESTLPSQLFDSAIELPLEERSFKVPAQTFEYLDAYYKGDVYQKDLSYSPSPKVVYAANLSAQDYLASQGGISSLHNYGQRRKKIYYKNRKVAAFRVYLDKGWRFVKGLAAERNLQISYQKRKEEILSLQEEMDYRELSNIFNPLDRQMRSSIKKERLVNLDEEIFSAYLDSLIHEGQFNLLGRIMSQLQKEQEESLEDADAEGEEQEEV